MNAALKHFGKNKLVYLIVFLFLLAKFLTISAYKTVWWDSAVYIGMGKYIYSSGSLGLWEISRPVIWPLILGVLWKIGVNAVFIGRILEIIFGALCIILTFLIGRKLFNEKIALLSSVFLALSPTFFFFNGIMLTEIVSTFFALLAIFLLLEKKLLISGIFFGIAFLTRFLQIFVFAAVVLSLLIFLNRKNVQNLKKLFLGFIIAILPFLILNQILYNNIIYPFLQQFFLSSNSGWFNYHSISYYFFGLFKENILYLLSIFGFVILIRKNEAKKMPILLAFFLLFVFFISIKQKEMRFLIILLPFMYLLIAFSLFHLINYFKNNISRVVIFLLVIASILLSLNAIQAYYKNESGKTSQYKIFQEKLQDINTDGKIWVSNPIIPVFSGRKIDKLMYYPVFNEQKKNELISEYERADYIFLDTCDLACKPNDNNCENNKKILLDFFKKKSKTIFSSTSSQCEQFIFKKF